MVTPGAKRDAVAHAREHHGLSERRACNLVGVSRRVIRYRSSRPDDGPLRQRLRELAAERRRFGYRRLGYLLAREGMTPNHKKLLRVYREENLRVRRRGGRKRALGTRAPMVLPDGPNQRWSLDFVSDTLTCSRRFRILCVVDDYTRECLALVADTSLSGVRVARELTRLIGMRGKPHTVVSDNGTELTSSAILRWSSGITSHPASRCKTASSRASTGVCATNASTRPCSRRCRMLASCSMPGGTITTTSGHTRNWAGEPPPRKPANLSGGMPPDRLPSPQPTIMKEPDSTSDW
jgi:transposase InsO family protein